MYASFNSPKNVKTLHILISNATSISENWHLSLA